MKLVACDGIFPTLEEEVSYSFSAVAVGAAGGGGFPNTEKVLIERSVAGAKLSDDSSLGSSKVMNGLEEVLRRDGGVNEFHSLGVASRHLPLLKVAVLECGMILLSRG